MFCEKHQIVMLCLPPHSTDLLQFLDVEVFQSLSTIYKLKLEGFTRLEVDYLINKSDFIKLYLQAREAALFTSTIRES